MPAYSGVNFVSAQKDIIFAGIKFVPPTLPFPFITANLHLKLPRKHLRLSEFPCDKYQEPRSSGPKTSYQVAP